eukprot:1178604-Prorocentrum_minimum.AAC.1
MKVKTVGSFVGGPSKAGGAQNYASTYAFNFPEISPTRPTPRRGSAHGSKHPSGDGVSPPLPQMVRKWHYKTRLQELTKGYNAFKRSIQVSRLPLSQVHQQ